MSRMSGEERRPQIAAAALKIIAEQGAAGFTTRALSREVGLAEGTIFRHFGSKEEIVRAAVEHLEQVLGEDLAPLQEGDPVRRLGRFFRRRVALINERPGLVRILFSDELARAGDPQDAERIRGLKQRLLTFVQSCITEAAAAGRVRPGVDPAHAILLVKGLAMAVLFVGGTPAERWRPADPSTLWNTLQRLLFCESSTEGDA